MYNIWQEVRNVWVVTRSRNIPTPCSSTKLSVTLRRRGCNSSRSMSGLRTTSFTTNTHPAHTGRFGLVNYKGDFCALTSARVNGFKHYLRFLNTFLASMCI